jgi:hypothetical protein
VCIVLNVVLAVEKTYCSVVEPEPEPEPQVFAFAEPGSGSKIKWITKVKKRFKNQNERPISEILRNNAASNSKRQDFVQIF